MSLSRHVSSLPGPWASSELGPDSSRIPHIFFHSSCEPQGQRETLRNRQGRVQEVVATDLVLSIRWEGKRPGGCAEEDQSHVRTERGEAHAGHCAKADSSGWKPRPVPGGRGMPAVEPGTALCG